MNLWTKASYGLGLALFCFTMSAALNMSMFLIYGIIGLLLVATYLLIGVGSSKEKTNKEII